MTCFCAPEIFSSKKKIIEKKKRQAWNCLDSLNLQYYLLWLAFNYIKPQQKLQKQSFVHKNFMRACNFIKKRVQHRYFPVNLEKILKELFLQNTSSGCFWNYYSFFRLKNTFVLIKLLINQSFAEINMILITIRVDRMDVFLLCRCSDFKIHKMWGKKLDKIYYFKFYSIYIILIHMDWT